MTVARRSDMPCATVSEIRNDLRRSCGAQKRSPASGRASGNPAGFEPATSTLRKGCSIRLELQGSFRRHGSNVEVHADIYRVVGPAWRTHWISVDRLSERVININNPENMTSILMISVVQADPPVVGRGMRCDDGRQSETRKTTTHLRNSERASFTSGNNSL